MPFKTPLKIFLSYSHRDGPELFLEFKDQLGTLAKDGLVEMWSDRDITAGEDWDREIKTSVNDCDLFIALTSAAFGASPYINGIEMQTAWNRHTVGHCRIVPIMWRQWRPPERFRALQFLPDLDHDVANAKNRDDVLYRVIVRIEEVVKQMTEGRWAPNRPALEPLPSELAYQCDWMSPIFKLNSLRPSAGVPRQPGVLILTGTLDDCAEAFLTRIHRERLPRALDADKMPVHDMRPMDWPTEPDSAAGFLNLALDALPDWKIERKLREGVTLLRTTATGWDAGKGAVLERILHEWSDSAWSLPASRWLVLAVSIVTDARDNDLRSQIEEIVQRVPGALAVVIAMPEIEQADAVTWAGLPEVRNRCRAEKRNDLAADIYKIYHTSGTRVLPMKPLAAHLMKLLGKYREKGIAA